jgi:hypothetical protein
MRYNIQYNIGKAKYVVNHWNGCSKHKDGSESWEIAIFKNKKNMQVFIKELKNYGYKEVQS